MEYNSEAFDTDTYWVVIPNLYHALMLCCATSAGVWTTSEAHQLAEAPIVRSNSFKYRKQITRDPL